MSRQKLPIPILVLPLLAVLFLGGCSGSPRNETPPPAALREQTWYVDAVRFNQGAHAGLDCAECHTDISMQDVPDRHPGTDRITQDAVTNFDYRACERCHKQEYAAYNTGVHADVRTGKSQAKTDLPAPVCGSCHTPHYAPANLNRVELISAQVETCGACHPQERETYLQNFHGKAATLADARSAGCTDCHGGHQMVSLKKTEDALVVCQNCHPAATTNMAGFAIHAQENLPAPGAEHANESTLFFAAKIFFTLLILGTLGFFYSHTVMWLIRSAHNRMRGG